MSLCRGFIGFALQKGSLRVLLGSFRAQYTKDKARAKACQALPFHRYLTKTSPSCTAKPLCASTAFSDGASGRGAPRSGVGFSPTKAETPPESVAAVSASLGASAPSRGSPLTSVPSAFQGCVRMRSQCSRRKTPRRHSRQPRALLHTYESCGC